MLGLRTSYGINRTTYEQQYRLPFQPLEKELMQFKEQRLAVKMNDGRWRLTPEGFLLSNTIIAKLQMIQEKTKPISKRTGRL